MKLYCSLVMVLAGVTLARAEVTLSADYQQLEWIGSATGAEYINTGYVIETGDAIETTFELAAVQPTQWSSVFGCMLDKTSNPHFTFQPHYGSTTQTKATYKYGGQMTTLAADSFPVGVPVTFRCQNETASWTSANGNGSIVLQNTVPVNCISTLLIFNQNTATTVGASTPDASRIKMKLYSFTILAADGETVRRNFVPCRRKSDGVVGLYETVEGAFCPNRSGSGRFVGPDDIDLRYSYVQLTKSQYLDTGYTHKPDTTVETVFYVPDPSPVPAKKYASLFGARNTDDNTNSMGFFPWNTWSAPGVDNLATYVRDGYTSGKDLNPPQLFIYDAWVKMTCDANGANWWALDNPQDNRYVAVDPKAKTSGVVTFYINGFHTKGQSGTEGAEGARFRSFKLGETSGVVHDYYPMRLADGSVGFYDTVAHAFISTIGTYGGVLHTVSADDATISVYEGTLGVGDLIGRTAVEKKGLCPVDATAVTAYPSLAIREGTLSFQNGAPAAYGVAGVLKLVGGARAVVDLTAEGIDAFTVAGTVDLSEASAANPFVFSVVLVGDVTLDANGVTLVSVGFAAGDEAKVRIEGAPLVPVVRNGALVLVPASAAPVSARWIGEGDHANPADAQNWICKAFDGSVLPGAVPTAETAIIVPSGASSFNWPAETAIPCRSITAEAGTIVLAEDCSWTGVALDDLFFDNLSIDLNGHTLTLTANNGETPYTVTVTDTQAGGRLVIDVPQGAMFVNTKVALSGSLQLVKSGAGTFVANRFPQDYNGGTQVAAGTFMSYNDTGADSSAYAPSQNSHKRVFGIEGTTVRVEAGATFDINGIYDLQLYSFVANGGRFVNGKKQSKYDWGGLGNLLLEADSRFDLVNSTVISKTGAVFNLNGHTLTVNIAEGANFYQRYVVISNGTFVVTGGGVFDPNGPGPLDMPGTTLDLDTWSGRGNTELTVSNLVTRYAGASQTVGTKTIHVYGSFKPMCDRYPLVTLHEGAAIDLSEHDSAWSVVSALGNTFAYAPNTMHIALDVGARTPAEAEQLVAWSDVPSGITFSVKGEHVTLSDSLSVVQSGIFFNVPPDSRVVVSATWTGAAGDNDPTNPANWNCWNARGNPVENGVPSSVASVTISGSIGLDFTDAALPWQILSIGSCSLTRDCDWRGLGAYPDHLTASSTIDLRGHKLFVEAPSGSTAKALTVTDSTTTLTAPGEFHFNVATNATFTNAGTKFTGNVRLVKEGAGTFVSQIFTQSYSGGTTLAEGTLKLCNDTGANSTGYATRSGFKYPNPLGAHGSTVMIATGTTFDINGVWELNNHHYVIEGGTIVNSKAQTQEAWGGIANISLTADSHVNVGKSTVYSSGTIDLGGKVLDVTFSKGQYFICGNNLVLTNGTIRTRSSDEGYFLIFGVQNARTVDFDIGSALDMRATFDVHDYTANYFRAENTGTAALNVWGTFLPLAFDGEKDYFYGCTMQNGSTLDLTRRTGVWNSTSSFTDGAKEVTFAANAAITVDLTGREIDFPVGESAVQIIAWETEPPPTTRFKTDAGMHARGRSFVKRPDGLYLMRGEFILYVR